MARPTVGVVILAHRRPQLLQLIVEQFKSIWPDAAVDLTLDRPSPEVEREAEQAARRWPGVRPLRAPFGALTHRENFMELREWQRHQMDTLHPKWCCISDDDHVLSHPEEARRALEADQHDLFHVRKLYLWDSPLTANLGLPLHNSVYFYRRLDGDRFGGRVINAPDRVHDTGRRTDLKGWLLDVGYLTASERRRVWAAYKRAGKIDPLTLGLVVAPPRLHPVERELSDSPWYRRLAALDFNAA